MDNEPKVENGKNVYQLKPWTKFYEDHVPESMEYPDTTLPDILFETASRLATKDAIIFKDRRISYREYDQEVDRLAAALQNLGVQKEDRVAIHLPNCPQFLFAYFAVLRLGAIVVPCNPTYTAREMTHQLNDSGARLIITLSALYPLIKEIRSSTELHHVIVAQIKDMFLQVLAYERVECGCLFDRSVWVAIASQFVLYIDPGIRDFGDLNILSSSINRNPRI